MATKDNFKKKLMDFITPRFLHTVATKPCVYNKLKECVPFADVSITGINDTIDEVIFGFGEERVEMKFMWSAPNLDCSVPRMNARLDKIE